MSDSKDTLGDRMKKYESVASSQLYNRVPVIIRVDGKNFSSFCKRFEKPYDVLLNNSLNSVMQFLCENIQGCKFAERHSDEISLLLTDFDDIKTDAFFDYNVQKICSVVASMATAEFCRILTVLNMQKNSETGKTIEHERRDASGNVITPQQQIENRMNWFNKRFVDIDEKWPNFDTRCFNIPEDDVVNYFWWRNKDATRNSISMLAQSKFSHKDLMDVNNDQKQEMLFAKFGINWGKLPQGQKSGYCCMRKAEDKVIEKGPNKGQIVSRRGWVVSPSPSQRADLESLIGSIEFRIAKS